MSLPTAGGVDKLICNHLSQPKPFHDSGKKRCHSCLAESWGLVPGQQPLPVREISEREAAACWAHMGCPAPPATSFLRRQRHMGSRGYFSPHFTPAAEQLPLAGWSRVTRAPCSGMAARTQGWARAGFIAMLRCLRTKPSPPPKPSQL